MERIWYYKTAHSSVGGGDGPEGAGVLQLASGCMDGTGTTSAADDLLASTAWNAISSQPKFPILSCESSRLVSIQLEEEDSSISRCGSSPVLLFLSPGAPICISQR